MEINKKKVAAILIIAIISYAAGRYTTPEKVKVEEKIVYVEKSDKTKQTDTDKKKQVVITKVETTAPDGTKTVTTHTEENTDTNRTTLTKEQIDKSLQKEKESLVYSGNNRLTLSALSGLDLRDLSKPAVFGAHISKPVLGPITLGIWGVLPSTAGVSLGLQF